MNPKTHPIPKTSIDLRRSINRLVTFKDVSPFDDAVKSGLVDKLIESLKEARRLIPKDVRDPDLQENQDDD